MTVKELKEMLNQLDDNVEVFTTFTSRSHGESLSDHVCIESTCEPITFLTASDYTWSDDLKDENITSVRIF